MVARVSVNSNNLQNVKFGPLQSKYSAAGDRILRYYIDFRHTKLNLHKELSAPELSILQNKVDTLLADWDRRFAEYSKKSHATSGKETATEMASEAEARRSRLRGILKETLRVNDEVNWNSLKSNDQYKKLYFSEKQPIAEYPPNPPYKPQITFFQSLFGKRKSIEAQYKIRLDLHEVVIQRLSEQNDAKLAGWKARLRHWEEEQKITEANHKIAQTEKNKLVDQLQDAWVRGDPEAILEHSSMVLEASNYDSVVSKDYFLQYQPESKTLLLDYTLPSPDDLPNIKSVRFIPGSGELKETFIAQKEHKDLFEDISSLPSEYS